MSSKGGRPRASHDGSRRVLVACLVATTAVMAGSVVLFSPAFGGNDDPVMLSIASGRLVTTQPDEHLMYSSVVIGASLRWLYLQAPSWPWYSLYLYVLLGLGAALTLAACFRWRPSTPMRWLTAVLVSVILFRFTMGLHFTTVGIWLAWASVAWCASVCLGEGPRRETWSAACLGLVGLGLAGLVRPESAWLGALMATPLFLWVLKSAGPRRAAPIGLTVVLGAVFAFGAGAGDRAYYASSSEWAEFHRVNSAKTYFVDNRTIRDGPGTSQAIRSVDWTPNDLAMVRRWFFLDEDVFSLAKMTAVIDTGMRGDSLSRVVNGMRNLVGQRNDYLAEMAVGLVALLVLAAPKPTGVWTLLAAGWYVLVALGVVVVARPMPGHVYAPCLATVVCSGLLFSSAAGPAVWSRSVWVVGAILLLIPSMLQVGAVVRSSTLREARVGDFRADWSDLARQEPRVAVAWGAAFPYGLTTSPLREQSTDVEGPPIVGIGTLTRTPFTRSRLRDAGVDDLHTALVDDPTLVLIAFPDDLAILQAYLHQRYQLSVEARAAFRGKTFTAWRLIHLAEQ